MRPNREALKAIRERSGLSRNQLAGLAGLHHFTISRIEDGGQEIIQPATARKLAEALQVPVVAITMRDPEPEPVG
jgi:transcriptional regulator with XRE-family HTH domain